MGLSKAYDCIPQDLLLAKLEAYGSYKSSLRLKLSYLNSRIQRVKIETCLSKYGKIKVVFLRDLCLDPCFLILL